MEHNTAVVPAGQGTYSTTHQLGYGTYINPKGEPPHEAPIRGNGNPDTNVTSGDPRQTPKRGGYCSGSRGTTYGTGGRHIGDKGRASEGMVKGGDMGNGTRHMTVG